jgi:Arc/MetJ family transcription regulator
MKHLIDLDEDALAAARAALGTTTIRATVNEALRRAAIEANRESRIRASLDALASMPALDRADAWR